MISHKLIGVIVVVVIAIVLAIVLPITLSENMTASQKTMYSKWESKLNLYAALLMSPPYMTPHNAAKTIERKNYVIKEMGITPTGVIDADFDKAVKLLLQRIQKRDKKATNLAEWFLKQFNDRGLGLYPIYMS